MTQIDAYHDRKILVTGAGGFIGSHLTEALAAAGAEVTALVHYNAAGACGHLERLSEDLKPAVTVRAGNIEDSDFVRDIVEGHDLIFHLAALIAIPYSYTAPRSYLRANVEGTMNVLEAARRSGVRRVVHTSTSEVYGSAQSTPIDESHPLQAQSPYAASKTAADKLAESYHLSFGTPVVTLRPFNTFGPRQSARAFIPTIIAQALTQDRVRLGALSPERDMTFVDDTVEGFLCAGLATKVEGLTINLGTGHSHSVGTIAQRILELMERDIPIVTEVERLRPAASEVLRLVSNNRLAAERLGWLPKTSLDQGLRITIEAMRADIRDYRPGVYAT